MNDPAIELKNFLDSQVDIYSSQLKEIETRIVNAESKIKTAIEELTKMQSSRDEIVGSLNYFKSQLGQESIIVPKKGGYEQTGLLRPEFQKRQYNDFLEEVMELNTSAEKPELTLDEIMDLVKIPGGNFSKAEVQQLRSSVSAAMSRLKYGGIVLSRQKSAYYLVKNRFAVEATGKESRNGLFALS